MKNDLKYIFGRRLNQARIMRGFSLEDLSQNLQPSITRQALNKYEKGVSMPDSRMLIALGVTLDVKPDYFFRPFTVDVEQVMFRHKSRLSEKDAAAIKAKVREELERYIEAEELCGCTNTFNIKPYFVADFEDVVKAANEVRNLMQLGLDGISSVLEVLEEKGIKVIEVDEKPSFEGLSGYANESIPIIVVNANLSGERKRFVLLHELAHLVITFKDSVTEKAIEMYCNAFAGEMLLPSTVMQERLGAHRHDISLAEISDIQRQFGVSVDTVMFALRLHGIITERRYAGYIRKKKKFPEFRKTVEQSLMPSETTGRFVRMVYRALANGIISLSKAATLLNIPVETVKNQLQLL